MWRSSVSVVMPCERISLSFFCISSVRATIAPPSPDASDAEVEAVRLALEAEMNRIAAEADRIASVPVIQPAPPRAEAMREAAESAAQST